MDIGDLTETVARHAAAAERKTDNLLTHLVALKWTAIILTVAYILNDVIIARIF